jgi:hypothetical protein
MVRERLDDDASDLANERVTAREITGWNLNHASVDAR